MNENGGSPEETPEELQALMIFIGFFIAWLTIFYILWGIFIASGLLFFNWDGSPVSIWWWIVGFIVSVILSPLLIKPTIRFLFGVLGGPGLHIPE